MKDILSTINSPDDIRNLDIPELARLAKQIRRYIISTVSNTGGHLAPSLGVVELTLVLHYLFDTPVDKIVWDVGHQSYAHKIITGRREQFPTIRQNNGLSGFPKPGESPYDAFGVGHSSTAISAAFGMVCARDLAKENHKIIAVVGDGALTGGLSFEGLNNAGASGRDFIVIVNDNSMSISANVGALSKYLTSVISNPIYNKIKDEIWELTGKLDGMGPLIRKTAQHLEESMKAFMTPGIVFEKLGFRYFGPLDGHNISSLIHLFQEVKKFKGPLLIHLLTKKGKGFGPAEKNAPLFHGLGKFDPITGTPMKRSSRPTFTQIFGETLVELAKNHPRLVAITPAMQIGAGLTPFAGTYPDRFFDVGIAEGHSVTFAAGLAIQGAKPVCSIYSSFLQRAVDMIIHDVALQNLPVVFAIDRAGIVGEDGPTHHGTFDISLLRSIPNMVIMAPKDENELRHMLYTAVSVKDKPVAIRYPRGQGFGCEIDDSFENIPIGISEVVREGDDLAILAVGTMVNTALEAADQLQHFDGLQATVINPRFLKPIDTRMLERLALNYKLILTVEEGALAGGFGSAVLEYYNDHRNHHVEIIRLGVPDSFVQHGTRQALLEKIGLTNTGICQAVRRSASYKRLKPFKIFLKHNVS